VRIATFLKSFLQSFLLPMVSRIWRTRGISLRALLCWLIALSFCIFETTSHFDWRFRLRGEQVRSDKIVLVYFDQEDWSEWHAQNRNFLRSFKEFSSITDSFYWNPATWRRLLGQILEQSPKVVGVTFFFSPDLALAPEDRFSRSFFDPRVIWAAHLDNEGRPVLPAFATSYGYNTALIDLRLDDDQVLRRFSSPLTPIAHMGLKVAETQMGNSLQDLNTFLGESKTINFRGPPATFPSIAVHDLLKGTTPKDFLKDKIVIIGSRTAEGHRYQTPFGFMNRAEVLANIADNVMNKRWIERVDLKTASIYLLLILILAVAVLNIYPQSIALVCLLWFGTLLTAISLWVFDTFYIWVPIVSPLVELVIAYIIFVGYQLTLKESQAWRLEREKVMLSELDQLKNNFVSLISHDLKTPIAKIQAICDRLMAAALEPNTREGLQSLRKESQELHRYIQSILQISRVESSQLQLRREPMDLNALVENVFDQVTPIIRDKSQHLVKELEPMFSIEIDGVLIQEVILNLVENASKYTPAEGEIRVRTQEVDDKVIFSVQDNGPGISKDDQEKIFEKFYRGEAHQSLTKGTGLGLFLVKYFVELHGGKVFLESQSGKGTRVGFTLPLNQMAEA
jgi:signal transduction histidine kinase